MEHKQTILLAPALSNSSCWRRDTSEATWTGPGPGELLRATLILVLSLGILCANLLVICVINSRRYSKYIHAQVLFNFIAAKVLTDKFSEQRSCYWSSGYTIRLSTSCLWMLALRRNCVSNTGASQRSFDPTKCRYPCLYGDRSLRLYAASTSLSQTRI